MNPQENKDLRDAVTRLILEAKPPVRIGEFPEPGLTGPVVWPVACTVGPGLEGAVACESAVGFVNGAAGSLSYRGYDIFDLCAHSTFEEVSFLLLHGRQPAHQEFRDYQGKLRIYSHIPRTLRHLAGFPVEEMSPMAALRLGTNLMRQHQTFRDSKNLPASTSPLGTDEDSLGMETAAPGERRALFEFDLDPRRAPPGLTPGKVGSEDYESCHHLIAGISSLVGGIHRLKIGHMPLGPRADLSLAANFLYMITGEIPDALSERVMDVCLILHADHGMNASTFAGLVVASTLSDIYFSVGAGIGALNGPLHGGANREVITLLRSLGSPEKVAPWFDRARKEKKKIPGFGHRVYKTFDPRALVLKPLAEMLCREDREYAPLLATAQTLEALMEETYGKDRQIHPNVDFYSGLIYARLGIPDDLFTSTFAVARMAGWTARIMEYLEHNRIFRPRAAYTGPLGLKWVPREER